MLIRSQDKGIIVTMQNTCHIFLRWFGEGEKYYVDAIFAGKTGATLAIYSTKEKAIKVLDMIEDAYNKCFAFTMENDGYYHEVRESKVFQMPQDEEVQA